MGARQAVLPRAIRSALRDPGASLARIWWDAEWRIANWWRGGILPPSARRHES